jgi:hypothetical protein
MTEHAPFDSRWRGPAFARRLARRRAAEAWFRWLGIGAIVLAAGMLVLLVVSIAGNGLPAFGQTQIRLTVTVDTDLVSAVAGGQRADLGGVIRDAMDVRFPEVESRSQRRSLYQLVSRIGGDIALKRAIEQRRAPSPSGCRHPASSTSTSRTAPRSTCRTRRPAGSPRCAMAATCVSASIGSS